MADYVEHYRDLRVYQAQRQLSLAVFELSKSFPKSECYSLTDQIRRSSRSIGAQIAEAWGKRLYPKHFVSKLSDADSEQLETQHWLKEAVDCQYISQEEFQDLTTKCESIGRMLGTMIKKADSFTCGSSRVRESDLLYLTDTDN